MRRLGSGWALGIAAAAWVVAAAGARAEAFEGVLKWRTLRVDTAALAKVAGDAGDPAKVFAVPLDVLMQMHGEAKVTEATLYVKGSKMRSEVAGAPSYILMDMEAGTTEVVQGAKKQVVEISRQDVAALEARGRAIRRGRRTKSGESGGDADPAPASAVRFAPLGRSETINGFRASGFEGRSGDETVRGWTMEDRPELKQLFERVERYRAEVLQKSRGADARLQQALAEKGVPVRVQTLDARAYSWEDLIEVRQEALADDLFKVPAGYTRTSGANLRSPAGKPVAPAPQP